MDLQIDVSGVDRTSSRFMKMMRRLQDPSDVLENQVADYLRQRQSHRFATHGDGTWPANAKSTVRKKGNGRPLYDSGTLFRALTRERTAGSRSSAHGDTLTFGTSLFYARFIAKRRPLFNTTRADKVQISARVRRYLMGPFE
jgi:phage gpG-like protein